MLLVLASSTLFGAFMVWSAVCAIAFVDRLWHKPTSAVVRRIHRLLKWPSLLGIILQPVTALYLDRISLFEWAAFALFLTFWWLFRHLDDDRPKRTKKALKQKVQVAGARLVVVPA